MLQDFPEHNFHLTNRFEFKVNNKLTNLVESPEIEIKIGKDLGGQIISQSLEIAKMNTSFILEATNLLDLLSSLELRKGKELINLRVSVRKIDFVSSFK